MTWKKITDSKVQMFWKCSECKQEVTVLPNWYQDNGTPVCIECDIDMKYVKTEIDA